MLMIAAAPTIIDEAMIGITAQRHLTCDTDSIERSK